MTLLELLAVVLLGMLPTLGRVLSRPPAAAVPTSPAETHAAAMPHHAPRDADGMAHMAHAQGRMGHDHGAMRHAMHDMPSGHAMAMPPVASGAHHAHAHDQHGPGEHGSHGEGDCDYCPLLHSLLATPGVALRAIGEAALPAPQFRMVAAALPWQYPSGLGSRGPPRTL